MSIIQLSEGDCKNCYKCIRNCHVKAIEFSNNRAKVIDEQCVLCGSCVIHCPQGAKYVRNDVEKVKNLLQGEKPVYASIAPSWSGYFGHNDFYKLTAQLQKLGFAGVEETAIGAYETSREYNALVENGQMKNIITTACPSVVMLVERFYPQLVKALAPVSSPMMAHARLMRENYGDIKVVFIGPCLSKKYECSDPLAGGLVNAALTFDELLNWEEDEQVLDENANTDTACGVKHPVARLYPIPGGIIETMDKGMLEKNYRVIAVDGLDRCSELFEDMIATDAHGLFIEANVCSGSCINGPIMRASHKSPLASRNYISSGKRPQDDTPAPAAFSQFPHPRVFANRSAKAAVPTEEEIRRILEKTGKHTPKQELNCGSCGYNTCREKAIAVYQGKADILMCLPFFRERAESISNTVIEHTPNAIFALDDEFCLQEINAAAIKFFGIQREQALGKPLPLFFGDESLDKAKNTGKAVEKKANIENRVFEQTVIYIKEHAMYLVFMKDITSDELQQQHLAQLRQTTIDTAQKVIDKQMRVAQEIASLLGETTAETKVALTSLKKSLRDSNDKEQG